MNLLNKFWGLAVVGASVTTSAAVAATAAAPDRSPAVDAGNALAAECSSECYLNLASRDGSLRTVLIRNGATAGAAYSFEILSRTATSEWEGVRVNQQHDSLSHVTGWKEHAQVEAGLTGGRADFRAEVAKAKAFVRRDQVAANADQAQLQRAVIKYLVALGYVGL